MKMRLRLLSLLSIFISFTIAQPIYADDKTDPATVIKQLSNKELLDILGGDLTPCKSESSSAQAGADCSDLAKKELVRRAPIAELAHAAVEGFAAEEFWAVKILEEIDRPDAKKELRRLADLSPSFGSYGAQMHFARQCENWALSLLNENWGNYGIPSSVWAEAIEQFGQCRYEAATENLVASINSASLNVVDAACESLKLIYPRGPDCADFPLFPPNEAIAAWQKWLTQK